MQFNQAPAPRESSLGDAYDPTADYSVDDLCIHDNVLCKCITPITGGEAWNPEHWTETNIADEISALNSNIHKVAEVSASIPAQSGTTVAYPNGFTMNNAFILATFTIDGSGNKYFVMGETSGNIKQNGIELSNYLTIPATICALIMKYE